MLAIGIILGVLIMCAGIIVNDERESRQRLSLWLVIAGFAVMMASATLIPT